MNKIFRGTLEVNTEVLDQNAISDSSDPLREVARHVSTPSLAWTSNTTIIWSQSPRLIPETKKRGKAGPQQPSRRIAYL